MWEIAVPMHQNGTQHRLYWIKNEKEEEEEDEGAEEMEKKLSARKLCIE